MSEPEHTEPVEVPAHGYARVGGRAVNPAAFGEPWDSGVVLVASGGVCAPVSPMYDLFRRRPPWEWPDDPFSDVDWDRVVAPRLARIDAARHEARARWREARNRTRAAWHVLRHGVQDDDDG